ncbi:MAG: hypothetical protein ACO3JL_14025 [Myxococcota bacterium]
MPAVFIAQGTLQQWADAGKVRLEDTTLFLLKEQRQVLLRPAVRFTRLTVGEEDLHGLLGKVKSVEQLRELGAEHYLDSVLVDDLAYEVVEGYLGDLQGGAPVPGVPPAAVTAVSPPSAPAAPSGDDGEAPQGPGESESDVARLSQLFLDTVR